MRKSIPRVVSSAHTHGYDDHPKCIHLQKTSYISLTQSRAGSNFDQCFCLGQQIITPLSSPNTTPESSDDDDDDDDDEKEEQEEEEVIEEQEEEEE
jgi:hypothetical protein